MSSLLVVEVSEVSMICDYFYRYRFWADECSQLFGGLDILCVKAIRTKDNQEFIIGVIYFYFLLFFNLREIDDNGAMVR